jgi:hypothetical protein
MRYLKGSTYVCLMLLVIVAVGCVSTNVSRRTEKINRTYGKDVPEAVKKKMEETDPQFYTVTIAEGSGKATIGYELQGKDGSSYKMDEPPDFMINGLTNGAKFWQVVGGTVNKGTDVVASSVQGYYGRKTQGAAVVSTTNGGQTNEQNNTQTSTQNN